MSIIRNLTSSAIELDDLGGITIPASSDYNLTEETKNDIANSQDLNAAIVTGDIVFLDSQGNQLLQQESLDALNSISSIFPSFLVNVNGSIVSGGPFSNINFKDNVNATSNVTSADVDFLPSNNISKTVINGQEMLTFNDPNRTNKVLSIEKVPFLFVQDTVSSSTYLKIAQQTTNTSDGYLMPMDGTVVGLSSHIRNPNNRTGTYDMHIDNDGGTPTLITYSGSGERKTFDNTLDYDINAGQKLQFRCSSISEGGHSRNQYDINVVLYVRWRG